MAVEHFFRFPMAPHIHQDNLEMPGKFLDIVFPEFCRTSPAGKHEQRLPFSMDFVVNGYIVIGCNEWHGPTSCGIKIEDSEISIAQGKTAENREGNGRKT